MEDEYNALLTYLNSPPPTMIACNHDITDGIHITRDAIDLVSEWFTAHRPPDDPKWPVPNAYGETGAGTRVADGRVWIGAGVRFVPGLRGIALPKEFDNQADADLYWRRMRCLIAYADVETAIRLPVPEEFERERPPRTNWRKMTSRYSSICRVCNESISKGETIFWTRRLGARHEACERSYA